jgi:hypothetical protein
VFIGLIRPSLVPLASAESRWYVDRDLRHAGEKACTNAAGRFGSGRSEILEPGAARTSSWLG